MKNPTLTYVSWTLMKQRCLDKNASNYKKYGGRGIKVCKRWMAFANFLADMGERPSKKYSLDRKNNEGGYNKRNCRWATDKEQALNRSSTVWIVFGGRRLSQRDWASQLGISEHLLWWRLKNWSITKAFKEPVNKIKSRAGRS